MTASVFVGTSVDGFIARQNGDLDWLPAGGGEPHGYDEFIATVDTIVIGRKTFETALAFDTWPYGNKRVVVLSSGPVDLSVRLPAESSWSRWAARRPTSCRTSQLAALGTSTSMVASRFSGFFGRG